jgi:hypothetical protein
MARELRRRGVTHVVMEASGIYTEPVYHAHAEDAVGDPPERGQAEHDLDEIRTRHRREVGEQEKRGCRDHAARYDPARTSATASRVSATGSAKNGAGITSAMWSRR